jgi:hypothetical protein
MATSFDDPMIGCHICGEDFCLFQNELDLLTKLINRGKTNVSVSQFHCRAGDRFIAIGAHTDTLLQPEFLDRFVATGKLDVAMEVLIKNVNDIPLGRASECRLVDYLIEHGCLNGAVRVLALLMTLESSSDWNFDIVLNSALRCLNSATYGVHEPNEPTTCEFSNWLMEHGSIVETPIVHEPIVHDLLRQNTSELLNWFVVHGYLEAVAGFVFILSNISPIWIDNDIVRRMWNFSTVCDTALRNLNPASPHMLEIADVLLRHCGLHPELRREGVIVQLQAECASRGLTRICTWIFETSMVLTNLHE